MTHKVNAHMVHYIIPAIKDHVSVSSFISAIKKTSSFTLDILYCLMGITEGRIRTYVCITVYMLVSLHMCFALCLCVCVCVYVCVCMFCVYVYDCVGVSLFQVYDSWPLGSVFCFLKLQTLVKANYVGAM